MSISTDQSIPFFSYNDDVFKSNAFLDIGIIYRLQPLYITQYCLSVRFLIFRFYGCCFSCDMLQVMGDPLEEKIFEFTDWSLEQDGEESTQMVSKG